MFDRAADSFRELGSNFGLDDLYANRAQAELLAGDREALAILLREAGTWAETTKNVGRGVLSRFAGDLAYFWAELGDTAEAERWLGMSHPDSDDSRFTLGALLARLRLLLLRGRRDDTLAGAREAIASDRWRESLDSRAQVLECAADVFDAAGCQDELRSTLDELANAYRRKGNLVGLERTERRIARLPG